MLNGKPLKFEGESATPEHAFGEYPERLTPAQIKFLDHVAKVCEGAVLTASKFTAKEMLDYLMLRPSGRPQLLDLDALAQLHVEGHKNPFANRKDEI